ncbi:MAG: dihydrodipicolinate synthase family protein [Phycisphaeraceae bacterium]
MSTQTTPTLAPNVQRVLQRGTVIPAQPLALSVQRKLDERRQRALTRYYIAAGAGGLAVGVHTTQFEIRDPRIGLFEPVLRLAAEEMDRADQQRDEPLVRIAGAIGKTEQAVKEAETARELGYHAVLLGLKAMADSDVDALIAHCRQVAKVLPIVGFYLQEAVGGQVLPYEFWRKFAEIENAVAIKMAPFHRYRTLDVVRAVAESGRDDLALYTGNDDNIVADLITPYRFNVNGKQVERRIVGGLLGHWAVWTRGAVQVLDECHRAIKQDVIPTELLRRNIEVTDMNAAVFDVQNNFQGVIAGVHEVLRRQGLLEGIWCLNPDETLGAGQAEELDRVTRAYPHLIDDDFIAEHRDEWLSG